MKIEHVIIISVGLLVSISLVLISNQPDSIPHWEALNHITQLHTLVCNEECKSDLEIDGAICTETTKNEYACRPPRAIFFSDREVQIRPVFPPEYGEFLYFPDGIRTIDYALFDMTKVDIIDPKSKEIQIEFAHHLINEPELQFHYVANLVPGQTFVSHCTGDGQKMAHIVEYLDIFEMEKRTYIEFWGSHVEMPDSLLPCQMPELIEHSIPYDLSLGINFELD